MELCIIYNDGNNTFSCYCNHLVKKSISFKFFGVRNKAGITTMECFTIAVEEGYIDASIGTLHQKEYEFLLRMFSKLEQYLLGRGNNIL